MLLTPEQLAEIQQIVLDYHNAFAVHLLGDDAVSEEVLKRLKYLGIFDPEMTAIDDVYKFGRLLAKLEKKSTVTMGYKAYKERMKKDPIALTPAEVRGVKFAVQKCAQHITKLGNTVTASVTNAVTGADRALRVQEIQDVVTRNIARRKSVSSLITDLRWSQKDWARDWARVAVTEKNNALQHGIADHYHSKFGGDSLVAKRPMPDACPQCKKHYLDEAGNPKIFKLSELEANGDNVGKKQADWLPVVGSLHPSCRCPLIRVPDGWGFNADGDLVPESMIDKAVLSEPLRKACPSSASYHTEFQGLQIAIESPAGSVRHWPGGSTEMYNDYGYIVGAKGDDGDELDCYVGPYAKADTVYVIDQQNPETGQYDERKVMLGFWSRDDAVVAYSMHRTDNTDAVTSVQPMSMDDFRRWLGPEFQKSQIPAYIATQTSQADNRAPSPGTSANLYFAMPQKRRDGDSHVNHDTTGYPPLHIDKTEDSQQKLIDDIIRESATRTKESFTIRDPVLRDPQDWYMPEETSAERDSEQIKRNRLWLEHFEQANEPPTNRVPVLTDQHVGEIQRTPITKDS